MKKVKLAKTKKVKLNIRKGDTVTVVAGDEKGKQGVITKVYPETQRAVVEGLNFVSKHVKPSANQPDGGVIQIEAPIHVSNLMLIDPKSGKPTRVGRRTNAAGKSERYSKKSGEVIK